MTAFGSLQDMIQGREHLAKLADCAIRQDC
jgi:hypothetical protein